MTTFMVSITNDGVTGNMIFDKAGWSSRLFNQEIGKKKNMFVTMGKCILKARNQQKTKWIQKSISNLENYKENKRIKRVSGRHSFLI